MIAVGLRLAGLASALRFMEWLGHAVWGRVSGFASRLALARSLAGTFVFGLIWGGSRADLFTLRWRLPSQPVPRGGEQRP